MTFASTAEADASVLTEASNLGLHLESTLELLRSGLGRGVGEEEEIRHLREVVDTLKMQLHVVLCRLPKPAS